jgi:hypothetical protein
MSTIQYKSHLNPVDIFSESYTKSSTYIMQTCIFIDKTTIMGSSVPSSLVPEQRPPGPQGAGFQIRIMEEGLLRKKEAAFQIRKEV